MESESVAAAMIRRFREAKPSSRAERDSAKVSGRVKEMWWVEDSGRGSSAHMPSTPPLSPSRALDRHALSAEMEYPRSSPVKPAGRPPSRASATLKSIDDLIMKDVMGLNESLDWDNRRRSLFGDGLDRSADRSLEASTDRHTTRGAPAYRYAHGRDDVPRFQKSGEALLHESLDTLGSIGFRGLNVADLKLDGANEPKVSLSEGQMNNVNADLEELLKNLGANKENLTKDGLPESILQVYNDVNANLIGFRSKFEEKYGREDEEAKKRAERDEEMKNIGREEERENLLKQMAQMDNEEMHLRSRRAMVLETSGSSTSDSEYVLSSAEGPLAEPPVDQQVHDLRSALQSKMRRLEELHADAMKETVYNESLPIAASSAPESAAEARAGEPPQSRAAAKPASLFGLAKDPYLNFPSRNKKASSAKRGQSGHHEARHGAYRRRDRRERLDEDDEKEGYVRPSAAVAADGSPGVLHDSVISAAKYITLNLNVAMDGLHQRLPAEPFTAPTVSPTDSAERVPSYDEAVGNAPGPRLPTYEELHTAQEHATRLPSYEEVTGVALRSVVPPPAVPSAKYVPPLSEAEKMSIEIDRVLGPSNSSLEESELAWWRRAKHIEPFSASAAQPNNAPSAVAGSRVDAADSAQLRGPMPWLRDETSAAKRVVSFSRPSAPVFPLPSPPLLPVSTSGTAMHDLISSSRNSESKECSWYLPQPQQMKYDGASEGLSLSALRPDGGTAQPSRGGNDKFLSDRPPLGSPSSITASGAVPLTDREMYLRKMQHYRATLSDSVL